MNVYLLSAWTIDSANFACTEFLDALCARTCYNCIYYRVNLSRCRRAATCLPTRLGLASHPTKVPPGRNALPIKTAGERGKAYGADPRARRSPLREPRNPLWQGLRVASGLRRPRVRLRREGDPYRYQHHYHDHL